MFDLVRLLQARLRAELAGLRLPRPHGREPVAPEVHVGGLPDKADAPFVLVQAAGGSDQAQDEDTDGPVDLVQVNLVCGVYANEADERPFEAGDHHLLNLLARVKEAVQAPNPLGDVFSLKRPLEWYLTLGPRDDPKRNLLHPYYLGVVETRWLDFRPRPRLPLEAREGIHG